MFFGNYLPLKFSHPEPMRNKSVVVPVFLPFAGCPVRCIFCSQEAQTGISNITYEQALQDLDIVLQRRHREKKTACEVAFYGGTFTALPLKIQEMFLCCAASWKKRGVVSTIRCSTRPDYLSLSGLIHLKKLGLDTVELGIQSFDTQALRCSGRNYTQAVAVGACAMVKGSGLALGLQLMPGMPGVTISIAEHDIAMSCSIGPDFVRLYPCLVFAGTPLAELWHKGDFTPWDMESTSSFLSKALLQLWTANISVIRIGVANTPSLEGQILAGPVNQSLGNKVKAQALFLYIQQLIEKAGKAGEDYALRAPHKYQGEFFGYKNELLRAYEKIGLNRANISWSNERIFCLSKTNP